MRGKSGKQPGEQQGERRKRGRRDFPGTPGWGGCLLKGLRRGPAAVAGEKREENGAAERSCCVLTTTPRPPVPRGAGEVEEEG